jgi:hypothetical protein
MIQPMLTESAISAVGWRHLMRLSTLLLVGGVLGVVFGLGFLLLPATVLPVYGRQPDPSTVLMSRFFGASLSHPGAALYLVHEIGEAITQRGLILAGIIGSWQLP